MPKRQWVWGVIEKLPKISYSLYRLDIDWKNPWYRIGPVKWTRWAGAGTKSLRVDINLFVGTLYCGFNLHTRQGFIIYNGWPFNLQLQNWRPHYAAWGVSERHTMKWAEVEGRE